MRINKVRRHIFKNYIHFQCEFEEPYLKQEYLKIERMKTTITRSLRNILLGFTKVN